MRVLLIMLLALTVTCAEAQFNPLVETRYCGAPKRGLDREIIRDPKVIYAYRKVHPCPVTKKLGMGACKGWALNHPVSLACGGCDSVSNLMWMRDDVKKIVDGYELKMSASTPPQPDTAKCVNVAMP